MKVVNALLSVFGSPKRCFGTPKQVRSWTTCPRTATSWPHDGGDGRASERLPLGVSDAKHSFAEEEQRPAEQTIRRHCADPPVTAHQKSNTNNQHHQSTPPIKPTNHTYQSTPPINTTNQPHQSNPPINTTNQHHQSTPPTSQIITHHTTVAWQEIWHKFMGSALC